MASSAPIVRQLRRRTGAISLALALLPLGGLAVAFARDALGANPIEEITHETGEWTLRCLVLCLAVTPLRRFAGASWLAPARRSFGLAAFAYGSVHVATWGVLDLGLDLAAIWEDIVERPFVTAGFAGYVAMVPLAFTSTRGAIRRLGAARWQRLHRLVYASAIAGVLHYAWLVKADLREPLVYGGVVALLLALRAR